MNLINIVFSGLAGAILLSLVTYYIYRKSNKPPQGKAYEILKKLGKVLEEPKGEYYFTYSSNENYRIASHIYNHADGEIIATAFHENPSKYGEGDLARSFKYGGSLFTRITCEEICNLTCQKTAQECLSQFLKGATFIVIPKGENITKIDGIFCKLSDNTYLCFITFHHPKNTTKKNIGIIFRNGIAKNFFDYYSYIKEKYENQ